MRNLKDNRNGSAMIIAILMATLISTMILGASRLVINEIQINSRYSDELVAKYAAEAGIERGLKLYMDDSETAQSKGRDDSVKISGNLPTNNSQYSVEMWGRSQAPKFDMNKDETTELNVEGLSGEKVTFILHGGSVMIADEPTNDPECPKIDMTKSKIANNDGLCKVLQVDQYGTDPSLSSNPPVSTDIIYPLLYNNGYDAQSCNNNYDLTPRKTAFTIDAATKKLRVRLFILNQYAPEKLNTFPKVPASQYNSESYIGIKDTTKLSPPSKCNYRLNLQFSLTKSAYDPNPFPENPTQLDQGFVAIRSVGTYGKVKKALEAHVSNNSNKAIEIFDYVIYAGDKLDIK